MDKNVPERIWAWTSGNCFWDYTPDETEGSVEYVRADLFEELQKENEKMRAFIHSNGFITEDYP